MSSNENFDRIPKNFFDRFRDACPEKMASAINSWAELQSGINKRPVNLPLNVEGLTGQSLKGEDGTVFMKAHFRGFDENGLAMLKIGSENNPLMALDVGACKMPEDERIKLQGQLQADERLFVDTNAKDSGIRFWSVSDGVASRVVPVEVPPVKTPWDVPHPAENWGPKDAKWLKYAPDSWLEKTRAEESAQWLQELSKDEAWAEELARVQDEHLGPKLSEGEAGAARMVAAFKEDMAGQEEAPTDMMGGEYRSAEEDKEKEDEDEYRPIGPTM